MQRHTLAGGRDLLSESALAHPRSIGFRRVTDGKPCAFCAMLASRGPAYRSKKTAGAGRRYHDYCGCTVEEVFGEWRPTAEEQRYIDLYEQAAEPGASVNDVMREMRAAGGGIVRDAHTPKTQAGGAGGGGKAPAARRSGAAPVPRRIPAAYDGPLGGQGSPTPPSAQLLHDEDLVAPEAEPWAHFLDEEKEVAHWLEGIGVHLRSVLERNADHGKSPDAVIVGTMRTLEIKDADSVRAIGSQGREGRKQSRFVVIRTTCTEPEAQRAIGSILSLVGQHLDELIVIVDGGASYVHWKA